MTSQSGEIISNALDILSQAELPAFFEGTKLYVPIWVKFGVFFSILFTVSFCLKTGINNSQLQKATNSISISTDT